MLAERRPTPFSGVACPTFGNHDRAFALSSHLHPCYCPVDLSNDLVTVFGDQYKLRAQFHTPQIGTTLVHLLHREVLIKLRTDVITHLFSTVCIINRLDIHSTSSNIFRLL
jgi:hypothetical protein